MKINQDGLNIIKKYESLHDGDLSKVGLQPKLDPVGIWTEGYGRAMRGKDGKFLTSTNCSKKQAEILSTIKTEEQAENALLEDTTEFSSKIAPMVKVELNDNQFSACVSLAYNIGIGAFSRSSVLKYINDKNFEEAANSFKQYNKGSGKILRGLVLRRESEKELFLKDD